MIIIDNKLVENITTYGIFKDSGEARRKTLIEDIGFRIGEKAKYVIITGCLKLEGMPYVLRDLRELLDYFKVDYRLLSVDFK